MDRFPLGYNTYSIRALRWNDLRLIEYAGELKLDAIFLQDSIDPGTNDPAHWKVVKDAAARAGLWLGTGGGAVLPKDASEFDRSVKLLRDGIKRSVGMGSPLVRMLLASDRDHLPPGPPARHIETMIKVLRAVRSEAVDAGVKFAIENHNERLARRNRSLTVSAWWSEQRPWFHGMERVYLALSAVKRAWPLGLPKPVQASQAVPAL
jgi:hypothetical protein